MCLPSVLLLLGCNHSNAGQESDYIKSSHDWYARHPNTVQRTIALALRSDGNYLPNQHTGSLCSWMTNAHPNAQPEHSYPTPLPRIKLHMPVNASSLQMSADSFEVFGAVA